MAAGTNSTDASRALYLDLLKRSLANTLYGHADLAPVAPRGVLKRLLVHAAAARGLRLVRPVPMNAALREQGGDWPVTAYTMVGMKRLDNLQACLESVIARDVPGDFIETGVWRGGASIFARGVLRAHGVTDRIVWLADSFAGLPPPDPERYPADAGDRLHTHAYLAVSLADVKGNFERFGLLDGQVRFLEGWFRDTLPVSPIERLAVLRLDGDMYESTMDALRALYPRLSRGGFVIVDDYGAVPACQRAVHDYRDAQGITDPIQTIDWTGAFWQRA